MEGLSEREGVNVAVLAVRDAEVLMPYNSHGSPDVLDPLFAFVVKVVWQLAAHLLVDLSRNPNASRFCDLFQTSRDIHPIPIDITVRLNDDIAKIDANAEVDSLGGFLRSLGHKSLLNLNGTAYSFYRAGEFNQEAITGRFDHAAIMGMDHRLDKLPAQALDPREGAFLVLAH